MRIIQVEKNGNVLNHNTCNTLEKIFKKEANRPFLQAIYFDSKNNTLVSTNGKSLLTIDLHKVNRDYQIISNEDGYFRYKNGFLVEFEYHGNYPKYLKIFPGENIKKEHFTFLDRKNFTEKEKQLTRIMELCSHGYVFRGDNLMIFDIPFTDYNCKYENGWHGIECYNDYSRALIMPMAK